METATVKIYTGTDWRNVTGRIVYRPPSNSGIAVEDAKGIRYWATMDRVKLQNNGIVNAEGNLLW